LLLLAPLASKRRARPASVTRWVPWVSWGIAPMAVKRAAAGGVPLRGRCHRRW
jgi:hypothetical protein